MEILLVEDNPDDVELTIHAFDKRSQDKKLIVVEDGQAALDYLSERGAMVEKGASELPGLILLDINLPKVGGLDVLRQIRSMKSTKHIPVVILTTSDEKRDIVNGYELGANSFIRKPVNFGEFVNVLTQISEYWLGINTAYSYVEANHG